MTRVGTALKVLKTHVFAHTIKVLIHFVFTE